MATSVELYQELAELVKRGERVAVATIIDKKGSAPRRRGAKMLIREGGKIHGTIGGGIVEAQVISAALLMMKKQSIQTLEFDLNSIQDPDTDLRCGGSMTVLIEPVIPPNPVVIFGGGHVGFAIYSILTTIDFKVTMVDDRRKFASKKRFPGAERVICSSYEKAFSRLNIDEHTYVVICTRAHKSDEVCLLNALQSPAIYVGMLGSKSKVAAMKKKMRAAKIPGKRLKDLHAPIGLDIGAVTPEEIAVSVAAEMVRFRSRSLYG